MLFLTRGWYRRGVLLEYQWAEAWRKLQKFFQNQCCPVLPAHFVYLYLCFCWSLVVCSVESIKTSWEPGFPLALVGISARSHRPLLSRNQFSCCLVFDPFSYFGLLYSASASASYWYCDTPCRPSFLTPKTEWLGSYPFIEQSTVIIFNKYLTTCTEYSGEE